ncbi:MAG: CHAP domain-containing protein [Candidatus Thiodiazotropha taylori]|nr:CHAP domain-containing protein [Candidatus Thiodiazotropha taylori]
MPTPVEFMQRYRRLRVRSAVDNPASRTCHETTHSVTLRNYFMMDWDEGTEELHDYRAVSRGSRSDIWFNQNKHRIRNAAMGKGAPQDYELALEWAVRSNKLQTINQHNLQTFCDDHLGIDCSGFVTNYLIACGKRNYSDSTVRNTGAASYFQANRAVNDANTIQQGDLLVWMDGNTVRRSPGHVAVVDSYVNQSVTGGNMRVVEATGSRHARPKLLSSMYAVERIIEPGRGVPAMILEVRRHGTSGSRVAVMRV